MDPRAERDPFVRPLPSRQWTEQFAADHHGCICLFAVIDRSSLLRWAHRSGGRRHGAKGWSCADETTSYGWFCYPKRYPDQHFRQKLARRAGLGFSDRWANACAAVRDCQAPRSAGCRARRNSPKNTKAVCSMAFVVLGQKEEMVYCHVAVPANNTKRTFEFASASYVT